MAWILLDFAKKHISWGIIFVLLLYIVGLHLRITWLNDDIYQCNAASLAKDNLIEQFSQATQQMKAQEETEVKRIKKLEKELAEDNKLSLAKGRAIMNKNISKECDKAIEEGIEMSQSLKLV